MSLRLAGRVEVVFSDGNLARALEGGRDYIEKVMVSRNRIYWPENETGDVRFGPKI